MEKNDRSFNGREGEAASTSSPRRRPGSLYHVLAYAILLLTLSSCNWKVRPSFPDDRVAASLKQMMAHDYHLPIETHRSGNTLQAFFWRAGLVRPGEVDLQPEALDALEKTLLCATRVALSTNARLDFIEIKISDVLTGTSVSLWRYVPDIRDSLYQRFSQQEYFNRLVMDVTPGNGASLASTPMHWDETITLPTFLAKQVVFRAKREAALGGVQVHEDLSHPATLTMVVDNWSAIEKQGQTKESEVADLIHRTAQMVIKGYRFNGFQDIVLQDSRGASLRSWVL